MKKIQYLFLDDNKKPKNDTNNNQVELNELWSYENKPNTDYENPDFTILGRNHKWKNKAIDSLEVVDGFQILGINSDTMKNDSAKMSWW